MAKKLLGFYFDPTESGDSTRILCGFTEDSRIAMQKQYGKSYPDADIWDWDGYPRIEEGDMFFEDDANQLIRIVQIVGVDVFGYVQAKTETGLKDLGELLHYNVMGEKL